jgi:hypothetical protein
MYRTDQAVVDSLYKSAAVEPLNVGYGWLMVSLQSFKIKRLLWQKKVPAIRERTDNTKNTNVIEKQNFMKTKCLTSSAEWKFVDDAVLGNHTVFNNRKNHTERADHFFFTSSYTVLCSVYFKSEFTDFRSVTTMINKD